MKLENLRCPVRFNFINGDENLSVILPVTMSGVSAVLLLLEMANCIIRADGKEDGDGKADKIKM